MGGGILANDALISVRCALYELKGETNEIHTNYG